MLGEATAEDTHYLHGHQPLLLIYSTESGDDHPKEEAEEKEEQQQQQESDCKRIESMAKWLTSVWIYVNCSA